MRLFRKWQKICKLVIVFAYAYGSPLKVMIVLAHDFEIVYNRLGLKNAKWGQKQFTELPKQNCFEFCI